MPGFLVIFWSGSITFLPGNALAHFRKEHGHGLFPASKTGRKRLICLEERKI